MDKSIRFWDRFAERYAKQPIADEKTYQKKLEMTQAFLTESSRVLEFGSGTGSTALIHAPKVNQIVAVDTSAKMTEIANRKLRDRGFTNVEFRQTDLFDPAFETGTFDAVLGLNILHLITDFRSAIRRAYDLLVTGGVFVTSTVCLRDQMPLLQLVLPIGSALGMIPKVQFISVPELEDAMVAAGFSIVRRLEGKKALSAHFVVAQK